MKKEFSFLLGSNQAGKGDGNRSLWGDGGKKFKENFEKIFKEKQTEAMKKICSGCGKNKIWKYHLINKEGNFYFCEDCKAEFKKKKKELR